MDSTVTPDLPEISLEHVEFQEESWDYGNHAGMSVAVVAPDAPDSPLIRWAVNWKTYRIIIPPKYDAREVVFEVGDGSGRTVTQTVLVEIDPGETQRLTAEELEAKRAGAREELVLKLRHMVAAYQYLVPEFSVRVVEMMRRIQSRVSQDPPTTNGGLMP